MLALISKSLRLAGTALARPMVSQAMARPQATRMILPAVSQQIRGMKVRTSVKKYCPDCYVSFLSLTHPLFSCCLSFFVFPLSSTQY